MTIISECRVTAAEIVGSCFEPEPVTLWNLSEDGHAGSVPGQRAHGSEIWVDYRSQIIVVKWFMANSGSRLDRWT